MRRPLRFLPDRCDRQDASVDHPLPIHCSSSFHPLFRFKGAKLKIAMISNSAVSLLNFRGPLIAEMTRRGYQVLAFAPDHDAETRVELKKLGSVPIDYAMSRAGTNPLKDAAVILELRRLLRMHRPDVSFAYFVKPVIYGTLAARLAGVPRRYAMIEGMGFTFTAAGENDWRKKALRWVVVRLFRLSLLFATRLLLLNSDDYAEFLNRRLVRPDRAALLGGIGVDLDDWPYAVPRTDPVTFILVARMLRDKGVENYVAAARIVRRAHPAARFLLVGGHDQNPAAVPITVLEEWVAEGIVEWSGHVPVKPWLARASVFVLPSFYREGIPRSTQEAMAIGLPIITTDVTGCRETVDDGVNGFLIPPHDSEALAKAMEYFIDHPEKIVPMGVESRRLAEERFDVHRQNRKCLELIGL